MAPRASKPKPAEAEQVKTRSQSRAPSRTGAASPESSEHSGRMPGSIHDDPGNTTVIPAAGTQPQQTPKPVGVPTWLLPATDPERKDKSDKDISKSGEKSPRYTAEEKKKWTSQVPFESPPRRSAVGDTSKQRSDSKRKAIRPESDVPEEAPAEISSMSKKRAKALEWVFEGAAKKLEKATARSNRALELALQVHDEMEELHDIVDTMRRSVLDVLEAPSEEEGAELGEEQEVKDSLDPAFEGSRREGPSHRRPQTSEEIVERVRYLDKGGKSSFERQLRRSGGDMPGGSSSSSEDESGGKGRGFVPPPPTPKRKPKPLQSISRGPIITGNTVISSQHISAGVIQYENDALDRLRRWIRERVGAAINTPEIRGLKVSVPEAYGGADNIQEFEEWLGNVLRYYRLLRLCGNAMNSERVVYLGLMLKGKALDWFTQEVESPHRVTRHWRFTELICSLYLRFITEATAAKAMEHFYAVKYAKSKGVLAFFNDLQTAAARMVQRPDEYTMRRRFMDGLPMEIIEIMMRSRSISSEHSSLEEIIDQAKQVESSMDYLDRYKKSRGTATPAHVTKPSTQPTGYSGYNRQAQPVRSNNPPAQGGNRFIPRNTAGNIAAKQNYPSAGQSTQPKAGNVAQIKPGDTGRKANVTCYACGKTGHFSSDPTCPMYGKPRPKARLNVAQIVDDRSEEEEASDQEDVDHDRSRSPKLNNDHDGENLQEEKDSYEGDQYFPEEYVGLEQYEAEYESEDELQLRSARVYAMSVINEEEEEGKVPKPFRSAITRPDIGGSRPPRDDKIHRCLAAMVEINGIPAYALFDSGSSADVMSPDFARVSEARLFKLDRPVTLQLGCVGSRGMINHGTNATTKLRGVETRHYFDIVNVDRYDVILGAPFMTTKKIKLDFETGQVFAGHTAIPTLSVVEEREVVAEKKGKHPSK